MRPTILVIFLNGLHHVRYCFEKLKSVVIAWTRPGTGEIAGKVRPVPRARAEYTAERPCAGQKFSAQEFLSNNLRRKAARQCTQCDFAVSSDNGVDTTERTNSN